MTGPAVEEFTERGVSVIATQRGSWLVAVHVLVFGIVTGGTVREPGTVIATALASARATAEATGAVGATHVCQPEGLEARWMR